LSKAGRLRRWLVRPTTLLIAMKMLKNHLKIAWRAAWRSKFFTVLNIIGLAIGFAGFMLAYAYISQKGSYDRWNPNFEQIYLVGIEVSGKASDLTPASLAPAIKAGLLEIEECGRATRAPYEIPFFSDQVYFVKNWVGADRAIARIFDIEAEGLSIQGSNKSQTTLVTQALARKLFPDEEKFIFEPKQVVLSSPQSGFYEYIHGTTKERASSVFTYECIGFKDDIAADQTFGNAPIYQTYIQVKPGTDPGLLREKINAIYRQTLSKERNVSQTSLAAGQIYLDPLKNLYLRPKHGSSIGYKITLVLGVLSAVILLLAAINFSNMMVVQAQKRTKEIGVKKIFGVNRKQLCVQFLTEVFVQCMCAFLLAAVIVTFGWNVMVNYFGYDFSVLSFNPSMLIPLATAILLTVLVCGLYPAIILSGYHPITIVKGNFRFSFKTPRYRNSLLVFQFVIVFIALSIMLVINRQMAFVKNSDRGFNVEQVVYIKNQTIFDKPATFTEVRNRMKEIPGVIHATVATNVPGGIVPKNQDFSYQGRPLSLGHVAVDYEYFEALDIHLKQGRLFSVSFPADTLNSAIVNESALKALGPNVPIGARVNGCGNSFKIIGVVNDSKMQGFEHLVQPTIYTVRNTCNVPKVEIMAKLAAGTSRTALNSLEKQWSSINKRDGEYFIYEFVEEKYAELHSGQEQLQQAFTAFTILIILVALLGLFGMSALAASMREKEISIRKVVGASSSVILSLLIGPFLRMIIIASLIAVPAAWYGSSLWLETFAYRVNLPGWVFVTAGVVALALAFTTVIYQTIKAAVANPVKSLRTE
jgi:putative ABC transport system permease protein